jgi:hypothetical protein
LPNGLLIDRSGRERGAAAPSSKRDEEPSEGDAAPCSRVELPVLVVGKPGRGMGVITLGVDGRRDMVKGGGPGGGRSDGAATRDWLVAYVGGLAEVPGIPRAGQGRVKVSWTAAKRELQRRTGPCQPWVCFPPLISPKSLDRKRLEGGEAGLGKDKTRTSWNGDACAADIIVSREKELGLGR